MPKGGATDRPSHKAVNRRPERFPERGLKERRSRLPRNEGTAFGEPRGASPVAGMKPLLARQEMTLRLVRFGGMRGASTQSAEPPCT